MDIFFRQSTYVILEQHFKIRETVKLCFHELFREILLTKIVKLKWLF